MTIPLVKVIRAQLFLLDGEQFGQKVGAVLRESEIEFGQEK